MVFDRRYYPEGSADKKVRAQGGSVYRGSTGSVRRRGVLTELLRLRISVHSVQIKHKSEFLCFQNHGRISAFPK